MSKETRKLIEDFRNFKTKNNLKKNHNEYFHM